jgi:hypothetical protein
MTPRDIEPEMFASIFNDILFIDSTHVSKVGSDVNYLVFEVLPELQSGYTFISTMSFILLNIPGSGFAI